MFHFLGLTFLNGAMLIALSAAAIPLIIHLSRSRRTKKMRFSTTRFFTDQFLRSYRMSRLKELLLLACRMALCALIAFAFAQPLLGPESLSFLQGGSRSVVLVLDDSASMGYTENGRTQLDRARDAARDLLGGLKAGDTVAVVLAGKRAEGPKVLCEAKKQEEVGDVLEEIRRLPVAPLGTDLAAAVARAREIAGAGQAGRKEIYVLSDLQDSGWDRENEALRKPAAADVPLFFVQLRPKNVANVAVTAVQYASTRPMVGVPFAIRPLLASQVNESIRAHAPSTIVSLYVYDKDGKARKVSERPAEQLRDGRWAAPRLYHTFTTGGWHAGYVEVDDDNLPQDNRRYFALNVIASVKVLAVTGTPSQVAARDELLFLRAALASARSGGKSLIQMDVNTPAALANLRPEDYSLVILADVPRLTAAEVGKLEDYVARGGSLLVFLGDKVDAGEYNRLLADSGRPHGGLLPARLEEIRGSGSDTAPVAAVAGITYGHPALAPFEDPRYGNLAGVTFRALWKVAPDDKKNAEVLMWARVRDGKAGARELLPLLCEKPFGEGRVLLFTSTCNRAWTNFPMRPAFLPWTHRLVSYLAQKPLGRTNFYATGERLTIPVELVGARTRVSVRRPDGRLAYPRGGADGTLLEFTDTEQPGVYTLRLDPDDGGPGRSELFAVNPDSYESRLTYLDDELASREKGGSREARVQAGLRQLLPRQPLVYYVAGPGKIREVAGSAGKGHPLWDVALWLVLVLVLFEPWLANRISLRHYAPPKKLPAAPAPPAGPWQAAVPAARPQEVTTP